MTHKITILQRITLKGQQHEYGHQRDYSKKILDWLKKNKINYQVTGDER